MKAGSIKPEASKLPDGVPDAGLTESSRMALHWPHDCAGLIIFRFDEAS
ncbi:hypothetical protein [Hymenobacter rubripertinctus]|nr:hypothetical protein [Hymenobacter rubripertinctus]